MSGGGTGDPHGCPDGAPGAFTSAHGVPIAVGRAFVAVRPPAASLDAVAAVQASLAGRGWRLSPPSQWHLTLRFVGAVADVAALVATLEHALAGREAFSVQLGGVGAFPSERRARVIWLGVTKGAEALTGLATAVGYDEDRPYHPHLTLARLPVPADVRPVTTIPPWRLVGEPFLVDEVVLYRSLLGPDGARHSPLHRVSLAGP